MTGIDLVFQQLRGLLARAGDKRVRYSQQPGRAFLGSRDRLAAEERGDELRVELGVAGLYGGFGALPDYFVDELLLEGDAREAARDFLDLFNHRLLEITFRMWRDYRFMLEDPLSGHTEQGQRDARLINRLQGKLRDPEDPVYLRGMRWRHLGLFRRNQQTGLGLKSLLDAFFPELRVEMHSFVPLWRPVPPGQFASLGQANVRIGAAGDFIAGSRIKDVAGGFRLLFRDLDYQSYMKLLPGGAWRETLTRMTAGYTKDRWECLVQLELRAADIPKWTLGERRLGLDMWLQSRPMTEPARVDAGAAR